MNFVLIFCNSTVSRLLYAHSHYNMCAGGGYMYQITIDVLFDNAVFLHLLLGLPIIFIQFGFPVV